MSKHTKNEFRALCGGLSHSFLNTYIKRGKIKVGKNKLIDDQVYENNVFVLDSQEKRGGAVSLDDLKKIDKGRKTRPPVVKPPPPPEPEPEPVIPIYDIPQKVSVMPSREPKNVNQVVNEPVYESGSIHDMDREKKQIDLQKAKEDLQITILKKQKLMGEVIPVDMVIGVFTRHFKNVTDLYYNSADTLLTEISHRFGLSREETGVFRKRLVDLINEVTKESMEISKKEIDSIVDDFSQTRMVGKRR